MRFCFSFFVCASFCACPAPEQTGPTPDEGAAHLGLNVGTTLTYQAGVPEETHELRESGVLFEGVAVDVLAKQNGFANDERTLSIGVDVEQAVLLRFKDCIARCETPDAPIPFVKWPLEEGNTSEGEAVVTDQNAVVHNERHSTTTSGPVTVSVPAGTYDDAFLIAWTRTIIDGAGAEEVDSAQLHWVPELGVVKHEAFDGTVLELKVEP